jgi:hypothetical protein
MVRVEAVWGRMGAGWAHAFAPRRTAAKFAGSDRAPGRGYFNEETSCADVDSKVGSDPRPFHNIYLNFGRVASPA